MKCDASKTCTDPAEVNIKWLVNTPKPEWTGGNFCGCCAAMIWDKVSKVPQCVSSAVISEPHKPEHHK